MSGAPERPAQAAWTDPHWVVVNLSHDKNEHGPVETGKRGWRRLFRHPTEASAVAECERLAHAQPGSRFAVYASGVSCKVDRVAPAPADPAAAEASP